MTDRVISLLGFEGEGYDMNEGFTAHDRARHRWILYFAGGTFASMVSILLIFAFFTPYAYETGQLIHNNKDKVNRTISSVLIVSEKAEAMLEGLESFLEFKVIGGLCKIPMIESIIGEFLCEEAVGLVLGSADEKRTEESIGRYLDALGAEERDLRLVHSVLSSACVSAAELEAYMSDRYDASAPVGEDDL